MPNLKVALKRHQVRARETLTRMHGAEGVHSLQGLAEVRKHLSAQTVDDFCNQFFNIVKQNAGQI